MGRLHPARAGLEDSSHIIILCYMSNTAHAPFPTVRIHCESKRKASALHSSGLDGKSREIISTP